MPRDRTKLGKLRTAIGEHLDDLSSRANFQGLGKVVNAYIDAGHKALVEGDEVTALAELCKGTWKLAEVVKF